jgi:hypothetical protein
MMVEQRAAIDTEQYSRYVCLSLGHQALFLPQHDIRILESVLDVSTADRPGDGVGWLYFEKKHWPVYCVNEELHLLPVMPSQQRICALLTCASGYFGLVCANVATVPGVQLRIRPLAAAMTRPHSPLCGLTLYHGRVGLVSTAAHLAVLLKAEAAIGQQTAAERRDEHG